MNILDKLTEEYSKLPKIDIPTHKKQYTKLIEEAKDKPVQKGNKGGGIKLDPAILKKRKEVFAKYGEDYTTGAKELGIARRTWYMWVKTNKDKL